MKLERPEKYLSLFFTKGISLKNWVELGILDREKSLYETLLEKKKFEKIYWFTYGSSDKEIAESLYKKNLLNKNIIVVPKNKIFKGRFLETVYSIILIFIHFSKIKKSNLLKSNQVNGSWTALIGKVIFNKPFFLRCGYLISRSEKIWKRRNKLSIKIMQLIEKLVFTYCDVSTVSNEGDQRYIQKNLGLSKKPIVINSFIDEKKFFLIKNHEKEKDTFLYIGRLSYEKNLQNIFKAIKKTDSKLSVIGSGLEEFNLKKLAKDLNIKVNFLGTIDNSRLNNVLNDHKFFILCSLSEGLPKSLLEAKASGRICIGSDVPGIKELIKDETTGFLSQGIDAVSISKAITKAKKSNKIEEIREKSTQEILSHFTFDKYYERVNDILDQVLL